MVWTESAFFIWQVDTPAAGVLRCRMDNDNTDGRAAWVHATSPTRTAAQAAFRFRRPTQFCDNSASCDVAHLPLRVNSANVADATARHVSCYLLPRGVYFSKHYGRDNKAPFCTLAWPLCLTAYGVTFRAVRPGGIALTPPPAVSTYKTVSHAVGTYRPVPHTPRLVPTYPYHTHPPGLGGGGSLLPSPPSHTPAATGLCTTPGYLALKGKADFLPGRCDNLRTPVYNPPPPVRTVMGAFGLLRRTTYPRRW